MQTFFFFALSFFLALWVDPFLGLASMAWYRLSISTAPFGILPLLGFIFDLMYRSYSQLGIAYLPHYFLIGFCVSFIIVIIRKRINFYAT